MMFSLPLPLPSFPPSLPPTLSISKTCQMVLQLYQAHYSMDKYINHIIPLCYNSEKNDYCSIGTYLEFLFECF